MTECAICYDSFTEQNKAIKFNWCNCQTLYCRVCLDKCNNCPMCRIERPCLKKIAIYSVVNLNQVIWMCVILNMLKSLFSYFLYSKLNSLIVNMAIWYYIGSCIFL